MILEDLTLDPPSATGDHPGPPHLDEDWLVISTIHSAKGQGSFVRCGDYVRPPRMVARRSRLMMTNRTIAPMKAIKIVPAIPANGVCHPA